MLQFEDSARSVLTLEADALLSVAEKIDGEFTKSVSSIIESSSKVIVCGMGKSGIIGKKIAATLASTGTPSFFMHPGEAYHGDLGMVSPDDVFIAISNSGETEEVIKLIPFLKDNGNVLIAMTGNPKSTLAQAADSHLNVGVEKEACPLQLAPTASTTAALVMGDALAVTLMKARDFKPENFARFHPGGSLGRRLLSRVEDEMIRENLPFLETHDQTSDVITKITQGGLGLAIIKSENGPHLITDGDLRRAIDKYQDKLFSLKASDFMSGEPISVAIGTRVEDAFNLMERHSITSVLVIDPHKENIVVGVFKK
jgi:arabinose-5-phosphate isomerase